MINRITIFVATLLCLASTPVLAQSGIFDSKPLSALTPMSESEVRSLLSDVMVGPRCCDAESAYYRDGRFRHYGYGLELGTWTLQGNSACALYGTPKREWCRSFYKDVDGKPFFTHMRGDDPIPVDPRPAPVETDSLRRMSETEIRALLTGATLLLDGWDLEAIYHRDGRYLLYINKQISHGHYVFKGDQVCVKLDSSDEGHCISFYADGSGRTIYAPNDSGRGAPVTVDTATEEALDKRAVELAARKD
ncbi:hypothetical protein ABAC460_01155 [Asticcacaulis sp. AC460]|uniref:hypothetical protein n=1 Tax=Asticcacaulis sp. AC460 TaxID=1282360 RepID=UPI0003C3D01D|nr:hypothetical protein [Asticcacaulis sp. AC460]ESQ93342.1 hypothetical protein ABAC460_01155 [Asticcacaulis sp. AC460]